MAKALSTDLRRRVVDASAQGMSCRQAAERSMPESWLRGPLPGWDPGVTASAACARLRACSTSAEGPEDPSCLLPQDEPGHEGIPGIDGELAGTVPVGHAGHGRDDGVETVYRCLARDGADEPGPHDRVVHQVLSRFQGAAGGEDRHPRCGAGPTR